MRAEPCSPNLEEMAQQKPVGWAQFLGIPIAALMGSFFLLAPDCSGTSRRAVAAANECQLVQEGFGGPVQRGYLGCTHGSTADGESEWTFPIAGPRGRGSLTVRELGGFLEQVQVRGPSGLVQALSCEPGPARNLEPFSARGHVLATSGKAPVAVGAPCDVEVRPVAPRSCRAVLRCGDPALPLFGGLPTNGFLSCRAGRGGLVAHDGENTAESGDPALTLDVGGGYAVIGDVTGGQPWDASIRLVKAPSGS